MQARSFRYGNKQVLCLSLSMFFAAAAGYILNIAITRYVAGDAPYVAGTILVPAFLISFGALFFRDVIVSETGLARSYFGLKGRTLRWEHIKEVGCGVVDSSRNSGMRVYSFRASKGYGPFFSLPIIEDISDAAELIELLNDEVMRRRIPIKAWRGKENVLVDRLPRPRSRTEISEE